MTAEKTPIPPRVEYYGARQGRPGNYSAWSVAQDRRWKASARRWRVRRHAFQRFSPMPAALPAGGGFNDDAASAQ